MCRLCRDYEVIVIIFRSFFIIRNYIAVYIIVRIVLLNTSAIVIVTSVIIFSGFFQIIRSYCNPSDRGFVITVVCNLTCSVINIDIRKIILIRTFNLASVLPEVKVIAASVCIICNKRQRLLIRSVHSAAANFTFFYYNYGICIQVRCPVCIQIKRRKCNFFRSQLLGIIPVIIIGIQVCRNFAEILNIQIFTAGNNLYIFSCGHFIDKRITGKISINTPVSCNKRSDIVVILIINCFYIDITIFS